MHHGRGKGNIHAPTSAKATERGAYEEIQAIDTLDARARGGGVIRYSGEPDVGADASGGGSITAF